MAKIGHRGLLKLLKCLANLRFLPNGMNRMGSKIILTVDLRCLFFKAGLHNDL